MSNLYVRSTDGNNADNGSTWALAKATLAGAASIDAAGDSIYVSQAHAESTASSVSCAWAGSPASPTIIVCGSDAAEPPTSLSTAATMTVTGASNITHTGSLYCYGIAFTVGNNASGGSFTTGSSTDVQTFESCDFIIPSGNTLSGSGLLNGSAGVHCINCRFKFNNAAHGIKPTTGRIRISGGSIISGGTSPTAFIATGTGSVLIENFDFSNANAAINIFAAPESKNTMIGRGCTMPASWSGSPLNGSISGPGRVEWYAWDGVPYAVWIEDQAGSIKHETTLVRTGGASDGTTSYSLKMVSGSNCGYPTVVLATQQIPSEFNATTGSSKTVTVEILRDSATNLKDNEIWLEVNYAGSSAWVRATDMTANVLTTAADQDSSSATWTTTGMSNPNKQKLVVTFTPQQKGPFLCRVVLAKASATVYVDPKVVIS